MTLDGVRELLRQELELHGGAGGRWAEAAGLLDALVLGRPVPGIPDAGGLPPARVSRRG